VKYRVSRVIAGPILHLLWRPEVTGGEHIPATGGAIVASNHLSLVDSIFLPLVLARPLTFAAKSEYFTGTRPSQRFAAAYLRATKQLSVDRADTRAAQETLQAARAPGHPTGASTGAGPESAGWRWPPASRSSRWG
jgi:1-acyl-sn-glycerol-3-phosphate acyltransferase